MSPVLSRVATGQGFGSIVSYKRAYLASQGGGAYQISRSLRFNSADSAYLNRTPTSASNRKTWTWAGWVKRSKLGTTQRFFATFDGSNQEYWRFDSNDTLRLFESLGTLQTTQVFRDVSAWYHIVVAVDTTQATASDRIKFYLNGTLVTTFSTATYPSQNADGRFNSAVPHYLGTGTVEYFDGYLAECFFLDGIAADPSSFTETDATTGQLIPKAYTGSYGSNGWRLSFSDNSTAAALGTDSSSNGNTWTVNNLSVTAGSGNDSLVDTPTSYGVDDYLGGTVRGNYCLINPLGVSSSTPTISDGNLQMTLGSFQASRLGTIGVTSGKWYWEIVYTAATAFDGMVGVARQAHILDNYVGNNSNSWGYYYNGNKYNAGSATGYGSSWGTGDVMGIALDMDNLALYFSKNGVWQNSGVPTSGASKTGAAYTNLSGEIFPALNAYGGTQVANWGQRAFSYTAPSGYKCLVDTNLPAPVIAKPNTVFDIALWTGQGNTNDRTITTSFNPDLVWIKSRSDGTYNHALFDSNRGFGTNNVLSSNTTGAEGATDDGYVKSTTSTSMTLGVSGGGNAYYNGNNFTYVGWTWDAGTSTVTNTSGSISAQVRANASAGFSVVTWTGVNNGTVGHGLGVAPSLIIAKSRSLGSPYDWVVYHQSLGANSYLILNSTASVGTFSNYWGTVSSATFLGNSTTTFSNNGGDMIAYCFAPVSGYSSFGSYTGNGSSDGPMVWTGHKPRWLMVKRTDTSTDWVIVDAARVGYNIDNKFLFPNGSYAESASGTSFDLLSNGFKARNTNTEINASGGTYIFASFAESPFQYGRAR